MRRYQAAWRRWLPYTTAILALAAVVGQIGAVAADGPPTPNPLASPPTNPVFEPVPGVDLNANGPAAGIRGDPMVGRILFARNCVTCHGDRGVGAVENPGSDDGTVPPLNPIDPVFIDSANGDPGTFTRAIDLFVQHGSRPSGEKPQLSMVGWGDHKLLSQQDLADIEAYVMQLNGLYWSGHWAPPAEVQMTASRADGAISYMTYRMTLINHGTGTLSNLTLHDQVPAGLAVVSAYAGAPGLNPAKVTGNLVEWFNVGIPDGGALGPFVIVAQIQDAHVTVEPNVSSLQFTWSTWDGQQLPSNVVSNVPPPAAAPVNILTTGGPPSAATAQIVQPSPAALSWAFSPPALTVKVGDTISWTNTGALVHTVTADDGSFDSGLLNTGESWSHTFSTPGTYAYHCTPHPWMKATVVVQGGG
jgi:plastocyanin